MNYRYYINGVQVSEEEAKKQMETNARILSIKDPEEFVRAMKDARFIFKFDEEGRLTR